MAKRAARKKAAAGAAKRTSAKRTTAKRNVAKRSTPKRTAPKRTALKRAGAKRSAARRPAAKPARKSAAASKRPARAKAARARSSRPVARRLPKGTSSRSSALTTVKGAVAGAVAAVTGSLPWSSDDKDAIELLEADHRLMQRLLAEGEQTTDRGVRTRTELLARLARELNAHELIEEKVLYPALQSHPQAKDKVLEGYQEHHVADLLMEELKGLARDDEQWGAKFKVLKENIDHHIEEEEGEMFRTARGIFSQEELRQLAGVMAKMKADALGR